MRHKPRSELSRGERTNVQKGFPLQYQALPQRGEGNKVFSPHGGDFRTSACQRGSNSLPRSEGIDSHIFQHVSQMNTPYDKTDHTDFLKIGDWDFFGFWDLGFGIWSAT